MAKNYKSLLWAGLSGLLMALAYPASPAQVLLGKIWAGVDFDLGWLVWLGFVPFFWSLTHVVSGYDRTRKRHGFLIGFIAGLVYFLIIFRWFWSIYPLDTLGIQSKLLSFVIVILVYFLSSAGMAIFWGLFGLVLSSGSLIFNKKSTIYKPLLLIPALFVLLEYAGSWGFGFLWAGSGSLFGPHWTFGNLAYALAGNPLALYLARFAGIYGITFIVVIVNILVYLAVKEGIAKKFMLPAIVFLILAAIVFGPKLIKSPKTADGQRKINFAIIQTAQPTKLSPSPEETLAGLEEQIGLLDRVAKEHPESQVIVFPEASDFFKNLSLFLAPGQAQNYFSRLFKEPRLIISGGRIFDKKAGRAYSRVFSLDTRGDIQSFYDKRLLAPGGEFLPYPIKLIIYALSKTAISKFSGLRELNIGDKDVSTVSFRNQFKVAPIICSELLSPGLTSQTTQNSEVIISMASYGIFHGNRTIADQMLAITRFRAAETAKPVVAAANLGRSYAVDSRGDVVFLAPSNLPQILTGYLVLK